MSHQIDQSSELTPALVNTWSLVAFAGESLIEGVAAELTFTEEGQVYGTVGVNRIMGTYQATPDTITFSALASTMMMGPPAAQAQESMLLRFLHGALPGPHASKTARNRGINSGTPLL